MGDASSIDEPPLIAYDAGAPHDGAACLARPAASCSMLNSALESCASVYTGWCGGWTIDFDEEGCAIKVTSPAPTFSACIESALSSQRFPCEQGMTLQQIISCGPN